MGGAVDAVGAELQAVGADLKTQQVAQVAIEDQHLSRVSLLARLVVGIQRPPGSTVGGLLAVPALR